MIGLERSSPTAPERRAHPGRLRHAPGEALHRHRHLHAFAAVVLSGGYVEAGDTGRHRVRAGDVVLHRAFESHLDRFDRSGAEVLVLPLPLGWRGAARGRVEDADLLARLAEGDPADLFAALLDNLRPAVGAAAPDWPDLLAEALAGDPGLSLTDWAMGPGLRPGSVSRGFRQAFGTTPAAYRLGQRTRRAVDLLLHSQTPLAAVAQACGFADQPHMTRAVVALTGLPPGRLRRRAAAERSTDVVQAFGAPLGSCHVQRRWEGA